MGATVIPLEDMSEAEALAETVHEALGPPHGDRQLAQAHINLDALLARLEQVEQERGEDYWHKRMCEYIDRLEAAEARVQELEAALREIAEKQQQALGIIESNGFVFDAIGKEPGNWQHLAFTLYTEICEIDVWARNALDIPIGDRALAPDTAPPTYASEEEMLEAKYDPADTAEER